MRYTKDERQRIIDDFAKAHKGVFDPAIFLKDVERVGKSHPAFGWYEWDDSKAAREYRLWQTRIFVRDLKVQFDVETVGRSGSITVRSTEAPMLLSPLDNRRDGGGYYVLDPKNQDHTTELCRQAGLALRAWLDRYQAALLHTGTSPVAIEKIARSLEGVGVAEAQAA